MIGGGYIGLELGSVWRRLGAEVTVVELLDRIVPNMDHELGTALQRVLARSGIEFKLGVKVAGIGEAQGRLTVEIEGGALAADAVLVAIGRRPYLDGLGLDEIGVARDAQGRIAVDDGFATNVPGIYAIGDAIRGPMLAHKAMDEGVGARRTPRRAEAADQLRRDPGGRLYVARGRLGRQDRGGAEGGRDRPTGSANSRSPPTRAPAPTATPKASSRSSPTAPPTGCSACTSSAPMPAR